MAWGIIIAVLIILGIGYYLYTNPSVISSLEAGSIPNPLGALQPTVSIPDIEANPANYLNKTIAIRANLTYSDELQQYFSNNQTSWTFPLSLPNQPNRQWKHGSTYLFIGHVSATYGCANPYADQAINSTACYDPYMPLQISANAGFYSFNYSNATYSNATTYCVRQYGSHTTPYNASNPSNPNSLRTYYVYDCYQIFSPVPSYYFNATNATLNG